MYDLRAYLPRWDVKKAHLYLKKALQINVIPGS
jgi:hypothetical protein